MLPGTLPVLLGQLQAHPHVVGLIRFGNRPHLPMPPSGDYDLFVVLTQAELTVRSLHFCIGEVPIDLNLMTLAELEHVTPADHFRWATLREGEVVYDPAGVVTHACAGLRQQTAPDLAPVSDHTIATTRHWHRHMLDKLRGRMDTTPTFCRYVLNANLTQLVISYFRVRNIPYGGETRAFQHLSEHEPTIFATLTAYLHTDDLARQVALQTQLAEQILAPIGGLWQHSEVLAFGDTTRHDLQASGKQMFALLFDQPRPLVQSQA